MKIWKKNMIAVAMLMVVCAGIYINWIYSEDQAAVDLTQTLNNDKLMSEDLLVIGENSLVQDKSTVEDYFSAVRLSRQEARDSAVSLLQEAMAYNDEGEAAQTSAQLESIVQTALCEAQIESLVIAKGYADCVAYIGEKGISVAVAAPEGGIQDADVAVIADIVMTQSNFKINDIHVVEVQ